jgi:hypothetical protein
MRWGLTPHWPAKDIKIGYSTFNAKAESIDIKPAFREAFRSVGSVPKESAENQELDHDLPVKLTLKPL